MNNIQYDYFKLAMLTKFLYINYEMCYYARLYSLNQLDFLKNTSINEFRSRLKHSYSDKINCKYKIY